MNQIRLGATGILCADDGRVLLGKRLLNDTQGGMWVTPGGGVELGETVDAAIVREFDEETGGEVSVIPGFVSVQQRINGLSHVVMVFKEVKYHSGILAPRDGFSEIDWFYPEEIREMIESERVTAMTGLALTEFFNK